MFSGRCISITVIQRIGQQTKKCNMKKTLILFNFLLFTSCIQQATADYSKDFIVPDIKINGDEKFINFDSDYIFDQKSLHTFELKIPGSALKKIDSNPAKEEYVEGVLIFKGDTISPVGIRYKGSIGAFINCVSGKDPFKPSGKKICTKLSMKVKIDWKQREQKFYDLTKLQFHSQNNDPSQMRERLGYWLFRSMGVPAPRSVHAQLKINGTYFGLYALTEQIDGNFARHNFDESNGNLYKEVWPITQKGEPQDSKVLLKGLKTNKKNNPNLELIKRFGDLIATSDSIESRKIFSDFMHLNQMISYAVVDRAIRNDDGVLHWYTDRKESSNHNYYWYEEPNKKKIHLIPWDLDSAFENLTATNPITYIPDRWGEVSNDCKPYPYGDWKIYQRSASCDKIIKVWNSYKDEYKELQNKLRVSYVDEANNLIDEWSLQIEEATLEASRAHDDALTIKKWKRNVGIMKAQIFRMKMSLSDQ